MWGPTDGGPPLHARYRYEEIADDLRTRISAGEFDSERETTGAGGRRLVLRPGQLPSRAALTEEYAVTEPVIDRAMQILRVLDVVETLPGVGVFIRRG
jgi:GntR family transcriptional regulator